MLSNKDLQNNYILQSSRHTSKQFLSIKIFALLMFNKKSSKYVFIKNTIYHY